MNKASLRRCRGLAEKNDVLSSEQALFCDDENVGMVRNLLKDLKTNSNESLSKRDRIMGVQFVTILEHIFGLSLNQACQLIGDCAGYSHDTMREYVLHWKENEI